MSGLLDFLKKYSHLLLFLILEGSSLWLLVRFNRYQGSVWFSTANVVTGKVMEGVASVLSYISLDERNRALTQKNILLEARVKRMSGELERLKHEPTPAESRQQDLLEDYSMIEAEVVNATITRHNNYITINKGEYDGVLPEMGVVCGTGVVGIVYQTSSHYSIVMPLLNNKSNISCRLRGTGYFGYLHWDGRNPLFASLSDIPRHARLEVGMAVETSGFSAVFPPGLFVGNVSRIDNSEDGLAYQLQVNLGTDFARLRHVCVVSTPHRAEVDSLQRFVETEK